MPLSYVPPLRWTTAASLQASSHNLRRSHFEAIPVRGGSCGGWKWRRFSGKNNATARRRVRTFSHAAHCQRAGGAPGTATEHTVDVDSTLGVLPETRCGPCAYESLTDAADCDGGSHEHVAAFRGPVPFAKFSWERGAKPMALKADGSCDGSGCFTKEPLSVGRLNTFFRRWGCEINRRRKVC